eukprot:jgi/Bigna1/131276/aug1.13_g5984
MDSLLKNFTLKCDGGNCKPHTCKPMSAFEAADLESCFNVNVETGGKVTEVNARTDPAHRREVLKLSPEQFDILNPEPEGRGSQEKVNKRKRGRFFLTAALPDKLFDLLEGKSKDAAVTSAALLEKCEPANPAAVKKLCSKLSDTNTGQCNARMETLQSIVLTLTPLQEDFEYSTKDAPTTKRLPLHFEDQHLAKNARPQ